MRGHLFLLPMLIVILSACSIYDFFTEIEIQEPDSPIPSEVPHETSQTWIEGDACFSGFASLPSRGIVPGIQAIVHLPGDAVFASSPTSLSLREHQTSLQHIETLNQDSTVTILDGPYCYETRNGGSRWWHVRVDATGTTGYVDEFSRLYGTISIYLDPLLAPEDGVSVQHFNVSKPSAFSTIIAPDDTIYISWLVVGASQVSVFRQDTGDIIGTGNHDVISFSVPSTSSISFRLVALAADGTQIEETRNLNINCAACHSTSQTLAYQAFENGVMIYRTDMSLIYVLDYNGQVWTFSDTWQGGEINTGEAPAGLIQPQMGFGNVWLNEAGISDALGWATTSEIYYASELIIQEGAGIELSLPDGRYINISDSNWQYRP